MLELGKYNLLQVADNTPHGLFLENKEGDRVLLPGPQIPPDVAVGDYLEVYIYQDNSERLIATTAEPKITLYEFAYLPVRSVSDHGAFLDYGVGKDLFVPFREQRQKMEVGRSYLVFMYIDGQTERLAGSAKLEQFLDVEEHDLQVGDEVLVTVWKQTDIGFKVIVNHRQQALLYANELFESLKIGDTKTGYIHRLRADGKIDVRLEKYGYSKVEPNAQKILDLLEKRDGYLLLTDKSSPEEIKKALGMSKKTFKKALGSLYKQRRVSLEDRGIRLL